MSSPNSDDAAKKLNLTELRKFLEHPEKSVSSLVLDKSENEDLAPLVHTCQHLFRHIHDLSSRYQERFVKRKHAYLDILASSCEDLYIDEDGPLDAESLWGQIDLQNKVVSRILNRSIKKLRQIASRQASGSSDGRKICLLDDEEEEDPVTNTDDDVGSREESVDDVDEDDSLSKDQDSGEANEEDEETRRMRERMERAMEELDGTDDEEESHRADQDDKPNDEVSLEDPVKEEINDGFFDIQEMEAFADEEEELLPDSAYEDEKPDFVEDTRSFHQRQRDGDLPESPGEDEEEDDDALVHRQDISSRRRKYRADDEVEALYQLYEEPDSDEEEELVNMTAADLYGKPKQKYYDSYKNRAKKDLSDDDSWNDFEYEGSRDKKVTWNDVDSEKFERKKSGSEKSDFEQNEESEDMEQSKHVPSKFARANEKLQKQTEAIEKEMLSEKPWQMVGEVASTARPENSLLDSTPEFERASKDAPVMTIVETEALEEVIKKRILNEDWDDVVPRELPDLAWHQKRGELPEVSQEKSKLGLGELYEREYLKKVVGYDVEAEQKKTEEEKAKDEMRSLFANLCSKLDALSNYHFAPRPVADEPEVKASATPAIAMEEILPLYVNEARTSAPEEIYGAKHGRNAVIRSESELNQDERKQLRSSKKAARRKKRKAKEADEKLISRLEPGLGLNNPYEKRKMREELTVARSKGRITEGGKDSNEYGKSSTFFQRMQEETQQRVSGLPPISMEPKAKKPKKSEQLKL